MTSSTHRTSEFHGPIDGRAVIAAPHCEHLESTEVAPSLDDVKGDWSLAEGFQAFWYDELVVGLARTGASKTVGWGLRLGLHHAVRL